MKLSPFLKKLIPQKLISLAHLGLTLLTLLILGGNSGCVEAYLKSTGGTTEKQVHRIFLTAFDMAWEAVLIVLKNSQMDISNREGGFVQTKWIENTAEKNFIDAFGSSNAYLKAQYRFKVYVTKGFYHEKPSVKITVQREQLTQKDVLEGWRPVESDEIEEKTLLYRIGRVIYIQSKMAKLLEEKTKKDLKTGKE